MGNLARIFYVLTLGIGIITVLFMVLQARTLLKKGVIERRTPYQSITKTGNPRVFWVLVIWILLGAVGLTLGLAVLASRAFGS